MIGGTTGQEALSDRDLPVVRLRDLDKRFPDTRHQPFLIHLRSRSDAGEHLFSRLLLATLSKCRSLAAEYDEAELEVFLTPGLTWTHVRQLLAVPSKPQRQKLIQRVTTENLTAEELQAEILKEGNNRKPGAGRRAKPPATVNQGIFKLRDWLKKSQTRTLDVLFSDDDGYDLPTEILNEPPDELTAEQYKDLEKSIEELKAISTFTQDAATRLQETLHYVQRVMAQREADQSVATE
jgi:hypothetical protein